MQITRKEAAFPQAHGLGLAALLLGLAAAPAAQAQTYTLTTLTSFNGTNGAEPGTHLTLIGGTLYGTTTEGGGFSNNGTVFSVPVAGGAPTTLAGFNLTEPMGPILTAA